MTVAEMFTPTSAIAPPEAAISTHPGQRATYYGENNLERYVIYVPAPAPRALRLQLEFGREEAGVYAHVPELDLAAEGADVRQAFVGIIHAIREWLLYLREEQPELAPALLNQARYVSLLDAPEFSWFKSMKFVD